MLTSVGLLAAALLVLGFPLWLVLLTSSVAGIYFFTTVPMLIIPQVLFGSMDKFVLLAVPGFIFAGEVMGRSGMAKSLIDCVRSWIGRIPGSIPLTTIATSEVFGAISGSSPATVAALGKILYPGLRRSGYDEPFSLGLITSSGAIASVIPPSITMILYAALTNASLGALFIGGVLPGLIIGVCMFCYAVWFTYRKRVLQKEPFDVREALRQTARAGWTLGVPVIIFGGIYSGVFTPTEAAGVVAAYAVAVSCFIQRTVDWRGLVAATRQSAELTAKIFLIVAAASVFSWMLTVGQVPQSVVALVDSLHTAPWVVLILINLVLLLAGMFIDPTSAILMLTPLLFPIAQHLGVDPVHFGIILTVNLAIGMFTPPFGLNIFVSSSIFNVSASRVTKGIVPFIVADLVALAFVTYVPALSLWLPHLAQL